MLACHLLLYLYTLLFDITDILYHSLHHTSLHPNNQVRKEYNKENSEHLHLSALLSSSATTTSYRVP